MSTTDLASEFEDPAPKGTKSAGPPTGETSLQEPPDAHAGPATAEPPSRPALTRLEAAEATGRNERTIRRMRDAGKFANAFEDGQGVWRVPVEDLLGAGLRLHRPKSNEVPPPAEAVPVAGTVAGVAGPVAAPRSTERAPVDPQMEGLVLDLTREVAEWRARAEERERHLADLRSTGSLHEHLLRELVRHKELEPGQAGPEPAMLTAMAQYRALPWRERRRLKRQAKVVGVVVTEASGGGEHG